MYYAVQLIIFKQHCSAPPLVHWGLSKPTEKIYFKNAMDKDVVYLLLLKRNRLLHRFYKNGDFPPKVMCMEYGRAKDYTGYYLSACAMMYASTGDKRLKQKVDYIVNEQALCQQVHKTGYVGAIPKQDSIFGKLAKG
jgi:DUF1680 family protein